MRSQSTQPKFMKMKNDTIKSGSINLQALDQSKIKGLNNSANSTIVGENRHYQRKNGSGIVEEHEESACSSRNAMQINSDEEEDCADSLLYPKLKTKSKLLRETRNSCHVIETMQAKHAKLEGLDKLKMPPVQTAIAQRRVRKATGAPTNNCNVSESQKRIKAILDKNNPERNCINSLGSQQSEVDAMGNFQIRPQHLTQRDLKSLENMQSLSKHTQ